MTDTGVSTTLYFGPWYRRSPFFDATIRHGAKAFDIYNHMYLPAEYDDPVKEYWHLLNHVTIWDVGVERQVEITGPDAFAFTNLLTPRDLSKCDIWQCRYVVITAEDGGIVNDPVLLRLGAQQPARVALSGKRPVDPAEGLGPDEVAEDEHVQRDLQLQLRLDLRRRVRGLPRLVVLDDPARAERVEVDPVDLAGKREGVEIEPSLQLRRRPLRPERDLEPARDELELRGRLVAHEGFEIAEQALLELAPL